MVRTKDTATFKREAYESTVKGMAERRERVEDIGRQVYERTGRLDPNADIFGKTRVSHNAFTKEGDLVILKNGIALPVLSAFDGTGSMGGNVELAFRAIASLDAMFAGFRERYNTQVASAVWQDVCDPHPPVQRTQFESDIRIAEQMRLLLPDHGGGDPEEDYDLGLADLLLATETDISAFYGLKGYAFIVADQIGRGEVQPDAVQQYLGHQLQETMATEEICSKLLKNWHLYYVQVGSGGGATRNYVTEWWEDKLEPGRVIVVPNPDFLAEIQAGLLYVSETPRPNQDGLTEFLLAGGQNKRLTRNETGEVWEWLQAAEQRFGAQARLPGYDDIPKPGDVFEHYRDPWPIGHPRFSENPSQGGSPKPPTAVTPDDSPSIGWDKF